MKKNNNRINRNKELLSFYIIKNASEGDIDALHRVLEQYESYIRNLTEYYGAAEPPVRCGESHLSGLTEPPF